MKTTWIVTLSVVLCFCYRDNLFAELTRSDLKEEIQHVDKRIDDLRAEVQGMRSEAQGMQSEINGMRTDIKAESKDMRSELKDMKSELQGFMLWGFGIVFAGIFALIGFVLWDRRTAIAPAIRKNQELEERENKVESALKEYAEKEPRLKEALKRAGLL